MTSVFARQWAVKLTLFQESKHKLVHEFDGEDRTVLIVTSWQGARSNKMTLVKKFLKDESGATAIEYGLIAALISVVIIGAATAMGDALFDTFNTITEKLGGTKATKS